MTIPNIPINYKAETIPDSVWEVIGPEFYRPRQHGLWKSLTKLVKKVVKYTAPIIIPIVAAPIAAAIGASAAIGSTAASVLVGAGLGAATSAATGGDPMLGAVMGGAGGYFAAPAVGSTGYTAGPNLFGGIGQGVSSAVNYVRDAAGNLVSSLTGQPAPQTYAQATPAYGASNPIAAAENAAYSAGIPSSQAPAFIPPTTYPGVIETPTGNVYGKAHTVNPPNTMEAATTGGSFVNPNQVDINMQDTGGPDLFNVNRRNVSYTENMPGFPKDFDATTTAGTATSGQQAGLSYSNEPAPSWRSWGTEVTDPSQVGTFQQIKDAFKSVPTELKNKFTDPKQLANSLLQGGVMVAASYLGGMGGSAEQEANQQAMNEYLQELKARDAEAYGTLMEAAKNQLKMAGQFNPQYFAQLRHNLELQKQSAQQQQLLRQAGLRTGSEQSEARRRLQLAGAQNLGTAYTGGLLAGADMTNKLTAGASGLMDKARAGGTAYWNALTGQGKAIADEQLAQANATQGWQETLGSLIPSDKDELEKELEEWKAKYAEATKKA